MRRRSRLLRVAKWGGVVLSGLIGIVAVASLWWSVSWSSATGRARIAVSDAGLFVSSFAVAVILTAYLFRLDRRPLPPGHCPCGYDLTGNESGTCPECGRPMPTDA